MGGNCGVELLSLVQVEMLFSSGEGEEDLAEDWVEDVIWEFLQVVVEEVDVKQLKDQSRQEGEGGAKGHAKCVR